MRKAYHGMEAIFSDDKLQIICLGYDFTAEHEFGIKELKSNFGIETNEEPKGFIKFLKSFFVKEKRGIDKITITKVPDNLLTSQMKITVNKKSHKVYFVGTGSSWRTVYQNTEDFALTIKNQMNFSNEVNAWWDEKSFLIASTNQQIINQLVTAFGQKDIAIWQAGQTNPFAGDGLVFAIKSNLTPDLLNDLYLN